MLLEGMALNIQRETEAQTESGSWVLFRAAPGLLCSAVDGVLLESSSRLLISSTLKNFHLLTILVVTAEDLGMYTCSVHNALGMAATTAVLRKAGAWGSPGPQWEQEAGSRQAITSSQRFPMGAAGLALGPLT